MPPRSSVSGTRPPKYPPRKAAATEGGVIQAAMRQSNAACPSMRDAARERRRGADGDVRPRSRRRAARSQNYGRQAQAAEHEPEGAPEHACPEGRRGR